MNSTVARLVRMGAILVAVGGSTLACNGAWAQTARTIRLMVPYQPGGGDILARLLAQHIGHTRGPSTRGPSVVIENRAGGGSVIGAEAVARAAPDGNTLLLPTSDVVITPHLRKLSYDPLTAFGESGFPDYEAVNWIGVLAPAKTPRELVSQLADWMKAAVEAPEVRAKLSPQGLFPSVACGADFAVILRRHDAYGGAIREAGIRAE